MMNNIDPIKNITVTSCYDHLGGLLGEAILKFFLKENLIKMNGNDFIVTEKGWDELEIIGINVDKLRSTKRKKVNICFESKHGILYEHLGSHLGSLLMERLIDLEWIKKIDEKKLQLTEKGRSGLESMGIKIKKFSKKQKNII